MTTKQTSATTKTKRHTIWSSENRDSDSQGLRGSVIGKENDGTLQKTIQETLLIQRKEKDAIIAARETNILISQAEREKQCKTEVRTECQKT